MSDSKPRASIILPSDFLFGELRADHKQPPPVAQPPPLGPLSAFVGDWVGNGFNTIFRPDSTASPTKLPNAVPPPPPPQDNILELNLTSETLSFFEEPGFGSESRHGGAARRLQEVITVPPYTVGQPPFAIKAKRSVQGQRVPTFSVTPPFDLPASRQITVHFTQIQYTQTVLLNFAGLTWPHVSVNTLVPADDIVVPASIWK